MRRLPLVALSLCVAIMGVGLAVPNRTGRIEGVVERDGARTVRRYAFGRFLAVRVEHDPRLRVSGDLANELKRLSLKLPLGTSEFLESADRFYAEGPRVTYGLVGKVTAPARDLVNAFARQLPHPQRHVAQGREAAGGVCADGRSRIHVVAIRNGAETSFSLYLTVRR
jgi:hypothetical protein